MTHSTQKTVIVIFGATGDLAKRKLFPSLFNLYKKEKIKENFAVVGVARRSLSNEEFRGQVKDSVDKFDVNESEANDFSNHFFYHSLNVNDVAHYRDLKDLMEELDTQFQTEGNRIFYLAMAPEFFGTIAENLKGEGLTESNGYNRLVIEKPFGHDFESAQQLNEQIRKAFTENQIYRIDHYLGKEMVQNIEVIRFANAIFEPLWNNRYIANIQITSSEILGVEDRGGYYETSGALRDMVQNHMMQMVALLAMEPPIKLNTKEIRSEKIKVLRALRELNEEEVHNSFVRGQYDKGTIGEKEVPGYREEQNVNPKSNTETFVAGKLLIDNFRWAGVPFYIRTGKRMKTKSTKIVIQFKDIPMNLYLNKGGDLQKPNLLVIHIQPDEGITLHLNAKRLGQNTETTPVNLDYCNNCNDGINTPEAYEKLIYDCMKGDATNFTHWDEVALSWKYVDQISKVWESQIATEYPNYPAGSMGPKAADELVAKDGFEWWPIHEIEK